MKKQNSRAIRTKYRILTASHILFAKHGFKNSTLRQITALSSSNLAAVHYHFQSKDGLIAHIIDQILSEFFSIVKEQYTLKTLQSPIGIPDILELITQSLIALNKRNAHACLLLYRAHELYSQDTQNFVTELLKKYEGDINHIEHDIRASLSMLSDDEINIRISFLIHSFIPLLLMIDQNQDHNLPDLKNHHRALSFLPIISAGIVHGTIRE